LIERAANQLVDLVISERGHNLKQLLAALDNAVVVADKPTIERLATERFIEALLNMVSPNDEDYNNIHIMALLVNLSSIAKEESKIFLRLGAIPKLLALMRNLQKVEFKFAAMVFSNLSLSLTEQDKLDIGKNTFMMFPYLTNILRESEHVDACPFVIRFLAELARVEYNIKQCQECEVFKLLPPLFDQLRNNNEYLKWLLIFICNLLHHSRPEDCDLAMALVDEPEESSILSCILQLLEPNTEPRLIPFVLLALINLIYGLTGDPRIILITSFVLRRAIPLVIDYLRATPMREAETTTKAVQLFNGCLSVKRSQIPTQVVNIFPKHMYQGQGGDKCSVCWGEFTEGTFVYRWPGCRCSNEFHDQCIAANPQVKCVTCATPLNIEMLLASVILPDRN